MLIKKILHILPNRPQWYRKSSGGFLSESTSITTIFASKSSKPCNKRTKNSGSSWRSMERPKSLKARNTDFSKLKHSSHRWQRTFIIYHRRKTSQEFITLPSPCRNQLFSKKPSNSTYQISSNPRIGGGLLGKETFWSILFDPIQRKHDYFGLAILFFMEVRYNFLFQFEPQTTRMLIHIKHKF